MSLEASFDDCYGYTEGATDLAAASVTRENALLKLSPCRDQSPDRRRRRRRRRQATLSRFHKTFFSLPMLSGLYYKHLMIVNCNDCGKIRFLPFGRNPDGLDVEAPSLFK